MMEINKKIENTLLSHVYNKQADTSLFFNALNILLNGNYKKYDFSKQINSFQYKESSDEVFQKNLSTLNEKTENRKINGVYYTPGDVVDYILSNIIILNIYPELNDLSNYKKAKETLKNLTYEQIEDLLFYKTFIDPTCGSGEFLKKVLEIKIDLLERNHLLSDRKLINISKTIFGNDIDDNSTDICKIRFFFTLAKYIENQDNLVELATVLSKQFMNYDFISMKDFPKKKFDVVIGNPPYVEYGKVEDKTILSNNYGNIFADAIKNSLNILNNNGSLGFIVPLSYVSTARMGKIRNFVKEKTTKQIILNFADRPDCLFTGVHQKLSILFANKGKDNHQTYISNYKHWYKDERPNLFENCKVNLITKDYVNFIPKCGNIIEQSILEKISINKEQNIYSMQSSSDNDPIFLNMRACFWIKAFSTKQSSSEFKRFDYDKKYRDFILCILNSSLFWIYWTMVSDCWHITNKELLGFSVPMLPSSIQNKEFKNLAKNLELKLEKTKKYIGSKQTEYEYKHKECKKEIDKIDEALAQIYNLSKTELEYVQKYAEKYRTGGKNV